MRFAKCRTRNTERITQENGKKEDKLPFGIEDLIFPILIPIKGVAWVADKLKEAAEAELYDEGKVKEELLNLQMRLETGEISEEEYNKKEAELLERLEAIRKYKEEKEA
ncbi:MAG: gas vesicle protein GvpG [bacterium (Candidatus Stahlbacteria) CG23_combo_of_CG06-09_8_20_14_all_40_9]|nr:MAG: gas vesicle protein GvpG [bacterium (Candidatus Stahlbacteria) CG23_combo_of_CG06-09_8_20_14_all_40_9]